MTETTPRALVTGVSRGIGNAIARRLLDDGWTVDGTYLFNRSGADELASKYERCNVHRIDLRSEEDFAKLLASVSEYRLDGLVNNAGVIHFEDMQAFDVGSWRETFEVNLTAPVRLARALEGNLKGGAIVNVASTDARSGAYNSIAYAASKAALLSVTRSLANLLARSSIRVNAVTPGWIATDMTSEEGTAAGLTPLGRIGQPPEVAEAVSWLLSSGAGFVTGTDLVVDGGYSNVDYVIKLEADAAQSAASEGTA